MVNKKKSQISKDLLIREFVNEEAFESPVGLGDAIERVLGRFGITEERFKKAFRLDECGCKSRKEWLNKFATLYREKKLLK